MAGIAQEDGNGIFEETLEQEEEMLFKNLCSLSTKQKVLGFLSFHLSLLSLNIGVQKAAKTLHFPIPNTLFMPSCAVSK